MAHDPLTEERHPTLRSRRVRSTGPGPGAGWERDPQRATMLHARIVIVATIVLGQLWGLMISLEAWLRGDVEQVWWLLAFQVVSFLLALGVWLTAPRRHR